MVLYKTKEEVEVMRESCLLVGKAHAAIAAVLKPGMTTLEIDKIIHTFIKDNGGVPSFLNYSGYPFATCISVNEMVVHGFPNSRPIQDGDILSIDIGIYKNKFHGDSAYSYAVGEVSDDVKKLLKVTKESLYKGIEKARRGNRTGDIGNAIQSYTEAHGYGVVRELVGHGLGKSLHEEPQVPNYGKKGTGAKLKEGMVLAIEPMINMGKKNVRQLEDGWTIITTDGKPSAHFEHDVLITSGDPDILTSFTETEAAEKNNPNLSWSYS